MKPHTTSTLDTAKHQGTVRGRCIAGTQLQLGLGMGKEGRGKGGGGGGDGTVLYCLKKLVVSFGATVQVSQSEQSVNHSLGGRREVNPPYNSGASVAYVHPPLIYLIKV